LKLTQWSKPRCGLVALAAHVPLADHGRGVAGPLQVLRVKHQVGGHGVVVVHHAVPVGVLPREDGGPGRGAQGGGHKGVGQVHAALGELVEVGRLHERLPLEEAQRVVAVVIGEDEHQVAGLGAGFFRQGRDLAGGRACAKTGVAASCHRSTHASSAGRILGGRTIEKIVDFEF
jgi:hypothetical protein